MAQCSGAILKSTVINHWLLTTLLGACARMCVSKYASVRVEPCVSETGKIESAAALPYHQFTVLHFLYVCMSFCMSSLYARC